IVLVEDPDGRRIQANREAKHMFGREFEADLGVEQLRRQLRWPDGSQVGRDEALVERALRGEAASAEERLALRPDGVEVPVLASSRQLARLISDLLEFSRIEARNLSVVRHPVDLDELARQVAHRVLSQTPDRPLEFEMRGKPVPVPADAGRLEQVLTNLMTNAV